MNYDNVLASWFYLVYMYRRIIIILTAVYWNRVPVFQVLILQILSLLQLAYLLGVKPQKNKAEAKNELVNELVVYAAALHCLLIFFVSETPEANSALGWSLIVIIMSNILSSMLVLLRDTCREAVSNLRTWF